MYNHLFTRYDAILQFHRGTLWHPWGNTPGVVALEACVQAHNKGCNLAHEGNEIIHKDCKWSPKLATICEA